MLPGGKNCAEEGKQSSGKEEARQRAPGSPGAQSALDCRRIGAG
jgi:hypothetical protein